jgi:hypothetical protein
LFFRCGFENGVRRTFDHHFLQLIRRERDEGPGIGLALAFKSLELRHNILKVSAIEERLAVGEVIIGIL